MQINKIVEVLEKAREDYFKGDTLGALRYLEMAEKLIAEEKMKVCIELGREGYDAIILK